MKKILSIAPWLLFPVIMMYMFVANRYIKTHDGSILHGLAVESMWIYKIQPPEFKGSKPNLWLANYPAVSSLAVTDDQIRKFSDNLIRSVNYRPDNFYLAKSRLNFNPEIGVLVNNRDNFMIFLFSEKQKLIMLIADTETEFYAYDPTKWIW